MPRGLLPVGRPDRDIMNWRWVMTRRFKTVVSVQDVDEIIQDAVMRAKNGDASARQFVAEYVLVKPKQDDQSTPDLHVGGNLNIMLNELSIDQLEALASLNERIKQSTAVPLAIADLGPVEASGASDGSGDASVAETVPELLPEDEPEV